MTKYNITEITFFKEKPSQFRVDIVDLDETKFGGYFKTREEAEARVIELKAVKGTNQPMFFQTKVEYMQPYIDYLKEKGIVHSVTKDDFDTDAIIAIPSITEEQFNEFLEGFR